MSLLQIAKWNYKRNNLELNVELEENMLNEEEKEFQEALKDYIVSTEATDTLPEFKDESILWAVVDMVDAYCDYIFVYYGTMVKAMGTNHTFNIGNKQSIMNTLLTEVLISHNVNMFEHGKPPILDTCMEAVIEANEAKPIKKTKGKVSKGKKFKDPKEKIKEILLEAGFVADPEKALEALKDRLQDLAKKKQVIPVEDL